MVEGVEALAVDLELQQRPVGDLGGDHLRLGHGGEVAHPAQQAAGDARRAARAARDLGRTVRADGHLEHAGAAGDDQFELGVGVEVEPHGDAEAVAQRRGQQARARGGADQRELATARS